MLATPTATFLAVLFFSISGQTPDGTTRDRPDTLDSTEQQAERADRESRRREWRDRSERARSATPEERAQMRLDGMVRMTARMYELDETQTAMVREEIERMNEERRTAMGEDAAEYDQLRAEMGAFWMRQNPRDDSSEDTDEQTRRERWRELRNDSEFQRIRDGLRAIEEKHPFDFETAAQRVEALLPADQAAIGRARREQRMNGWRERRAQWNTDGDQERPQRAERRMERRRERAVEPAVASNMSGQPQAAAPVAPRPVQPAAQATPNPQPPAAPPRPLHPWELHVRQFIDQHDLTEAQTTSAMAILRDVQHRAARMESTQADQRTEAEKITDPTTRQKRLAELNAPIDQLFGELKQRLDGLLTAAQRQKVGK